MTLQAPALRWLVPPKDRLLTPNRYGAGHYRPEYVREIEALIIHYTAGYGCKAAARWLANKAKDKQGNTIPSKASAHFVAGRAGEVIQLVPLSDRAWHAGGKSSRWRGRPLNSRSIGIEIANLGPLTRQADGSLRDVWGRAWEGEPFEAPDGSLWEPYTAAQLEAVGWLVSSLVAMFPRLALQDAGAGELPRITGHQDVDPTRKTDPGPAFPMDEIRTFALESNR